MGHHLYDENKRLKAENDALRAQLRNGRQLSDTQEQGERICNAIDAFLTGRANLWIEPGVNGGMRVEFVPPPEQPKE